jgi:hypothetical protein
MNTNATAKLEKQNPPEDGLFVWGRLFLAVIAAPVFGLFWAWAAEVAGAYAAPFLLFPILQGILTGLSIVGLVRFARIGNRPTILLATILASLVAGVGQHGVAYLDAYYWPRAPIGMGTMSNQDLSPLFEKMKPTFEQYLRAQAERGRTLPFGCKVQGDRVWLTWGLDAILVLVGAVVVTIPATRVPFCNRCGTWYRVFRGGKIEVPIAQQLATWMGVDEVGAMRSPRCRLSACQCGRGPTRCELSWEEPDGAIDLVQVWLGPAARNQAATILDGVAIEEV